MKNLDKNIKNELYTAIKEGNEEGIKKAFDNFTESVENSAREAAVLAYSQKEDVTAMEKRGLGLTLTSQEREFFNEAIEKKSFDNLKYPLPTSIYTQALKRAKKEHKLLDMINPDYFPGITKIAVPKKGKAVAFWGPITADIQKVLLDGFTDLDITTSKLSGYIAVGKEVFEFGPQALADYVVNELAEAIATTLEEAILTGDGENKPIGMTADLDKNINGKCSPKEAIKMTKLDPVEMGKVRAKLAGGTATNRKVVFICNPVTYWTKVFPVLAVRDSNGNWVPDKIATGEEIILSDSIPVDKAVVGDVNNYSLVLGGNTDITKYKETLAIEDADLYVAKLYGTGAPVDNTAFVVLDLSGLGVATPAA